MDQYKISVIVPVFNVAKYLPQCLDSLISQTLQDIEIICVNDGSTDGSDEIIRKYADNSDCIRVIHQKNKGLSEARNVGMKYAKGNFIGFVDGDDWIQKDMYEKLYEAAIESDADVAACNIICYSHTKNIYYIDTAFYHSSINIKYGEKYRPSDVGCGMYSSNVSACNKIYSCKFLKGNDIIFESGYRYEDVLFNLDVFLSIRSMIYIEDRGYIYRIHRSDSIMGKNEQGCFDIFHIGREMIARINITEKAKNLRGCTLRDIYKRQHKLLKRASRDYQEEYYMRMLQFWRRDSVWRKWEGAAEISRKIERLEKLGYRRWKRRDTLRAIGLTILRSCNLDYRVKNLRHRFQH